MLAKTNRVLAEGVVLLVTVASVAGGEKLPKPDPRIDRLEMFFQSYGCPAPRYSADYVRAADAHHLDYRILPAISIVETTCGINADVNNWWGWNSGKHEFPTIAAGIEFVTSQLAHGYYYKNKQIAGKLFTYNPFSWYPPKVQRLMRQIENDPVDAMTISGHAPSQCVTRGRDLAPRGSDC
jgi:hypothetical protein